MVISIPRVRLSGYRSMVLHGFYMGSTWVLHGLYLAPTKVYQVYTRLMD